MNYEKRINQLEQYIQDTPHIVKRNHGHGWRQIIHIAQLYRDDINRTCNWHDNDLDTFTRLIGEL